jgi:predicted nucleic acid-binding protein
LPRRVYWDSCTFLGLLNSEPAKVTACRAVWHESEQKKTLIYTSFFAFAEVIKMKCEAGSKPLDEANDKAIEALFGQSWVRPVVVDERIGVLARRLMRHHTECKKPSDAIHLATALTLNVDEMHTYDHADLLKLDGKVLRADSKPLKICIPAPMPQAALPPSPLFDQLADE